MLSLSRRGLVLAAAAMSAAGLPLALRAGRFGDEPQIYTLNGHALQGQDPVGYFTEGRVVEGDPAITARWRGATWLFASAENRDAFLAEPERYAPQYGGYCAYAMSLNQIAPTDPEAWTIIDGRLYLNYSKDVKVIWSGDIPGNVAKADANWPGVRAELVQ